MTTRLPHAILRRAWALDATWHPERMQGLGVLHALAPVLRRAADPAAAAARHTAPFNTNLWMAPALLGAMARLEVEGRGAEAARVRDVVAPPLSGMGDASVWNAIRPACVAIGVAGVLAGVPRLGVVLACALYATAALLHVLRGFARGAALGGDLARHVDRVRPSPALRRAARSAVGIAAGALYGFGLVRAWQAAPGAAFVMSGALVLGYTAAKRQLSPGIAFLVLVALVAVARRAVGPAGIP
jgi:mannose/fructose/N-acetylgalactosamine-specific phosphotransferase system component IID